MEHISIRHHSHKASTNRRSGRKLIKKTHIEALILYTIGSQEQKSSKKCTQMRVTYSCYCFQVSTWYC